jgi:hypothetical protein
METVNKRISLFRGKERGRFKSEERRAIEYQNKSKLILNNTNKNEKILEKFGAWAG